MNLGNTEHTEAQRKGPGTRRVARELALCLLFQSDLQGGGAEITVQTFEANFSPGKDGEQGLEVSKGDFRRAWPLARELFLGVVGHLAELDTAISRASVNWTVARMSPVDRSLIRLAYYEMLHRDDIPPRVSLNEALEIAKIYGDEDSGTFINGVLDCLMRRTENQVTNLDQPESADRDWSESKE